MPAPLLLSRRAIKYTAAMSRAMSFSRFIQLPENCSGFLAIRNLAREGEAPELTCLVLHGPPGAGKSCLVEALAHELEKAAIAHVLMTAGQFDPEAADGALRQVGWLIIEDLQHLLPFRAEGLSMLLDHRQAHGKFTIMTASRAPHELVCKGDGLPPRLLSRLAQGLTVGLDHWSASSRQLFLQELGRRCQLSLSEETWAWLAENLGGNGRQLESVIRQLQSLSTDHPYNLSFDVVARHFQEQADERRPSVDRIVHKVSGHFGVKARHLQSGKRARQVMLPRQVSMYLARRLTQLSLQQIGAYFGGRDHTTVLHACRKVEQTLAGDADLSFAVRKLQAELQ